MINDQLLSYIRQQLGESVSKDIIIANLKTQGWTEADINEAFFSLSIHNVPPAIPASPDMASAGLSRQNTPESIAQPDKPVSSPSFFQKQKKIILAIVGLIILCAIGAGAYAYYSGAFISLQSLTPKAFDNIRAINSATYDTTVKIDASEISDMTSGLNQMMAGSVFPTALTFTTKGSYDFSDAQNKKISSLISIDAGSFSVSAELRMIDNTLYGQLIKAPAVSFLPVFASYENKWFSLPLKSQNTQSLNDAFNPINKITGADSDIINKITPEQKEHFYQMARNAHIIKTVQKFSPEAIGGVSSYHFSFDFDRAGINQYLESLKAYVNTIGKNDSALSAFDPTSFSKSLDNLQDFKGEIWIGRKDTLPYKIMLSFSIQPDLTKNGKVKINAVSIFSGWNQPVSIIAPAESTPFQEFITNMMSGGQNQGKGGNMPVKVK